MYAIYKRELKAYINSFIGLLFMAVSLFFCRYLLYILSVSKRLSVFFSNN